MQIATQPLKISSRASSYLVDPEILEASRLAIVLDALVARIIAESVNGHLWLCDQAKQAAATAAHYVREAGAGEGDDRLRALKIARGAVIQVRAALNLLSQRGAASRRSEVRDLTLALVTRLTRLVQQAPSVLHP